MPLLIPFAAAGVGFLGGLFTSNGIQNLTRLALVAGAGYLIYTHAVAE